MLLRTGAVADRHADAELVEAERTYEPGAHERETRHERRCLGGPCELVKLSRNLDAELDLELPRSRRHTLEFRGAVRELGLRVRPGEALLPERELLVEHRSGKPRALRGGVGRIRGRERAQRRGLATLECLVGLAYVVPHDLERAIVGADVVDRDHENMIVGRDGHDARADRRLRELERTLALLLDGRGERALAIACWKRRQIRARQLEVGGR